MRTPESPGATPPPAKAPIEGSGPAGPASSASWIKWVVVFLPFGFLWLTLINQLRVEWSVNPQYSYGWVVPFLCVAFLLQRWQGLPQRRKKESAIGTVVNEDHLELAPRREDRGKLWLVMLTAVLACLYLPTRLVQEANPEWRIVSWTLALEVISLTLLFVRLMFGSATLRWFAFPICFFLVAVPWPSFVESPLIQGLTRVNSAAVVEVLSWLGIPAVQHGNLIEVSTGTVGVDEACSGIRSFQASLMVSLFFGEFYGMGLWRRWLLIPSGFALAMASNVCRMLFLTIIAASNGIAAIGTYHDPAGASIALICTAGLWGLAVLFNRKPKAERLKAGIAGQTSKAGVQTPAVQSQESLTRRMASPDSPGQRPASGCRPPPSDAFRLALALLVWVVLVEAGVESWYRWHEARLPQSIAWSVDWPRDDTKFVQEPIAERTRELLRYDEGSSLAWREDDGSRWQMFYFHWLPGKSAAYLASFHTPEVCLAGSGYGLQIHPELDYVHVHGLLLPFRTYSMETPAGTAYVFYCRWEDRASQQGFETTKLDNGYVYSYRDRLNFVLEKRRSVGQRTMEILVDGIDDEKDAQAAVARQLEKLINVEMPAKVEK